MASKHKNEIDMTIVNQIKVNRKDTRFKPKYTESMISEMLTLKNKYQFNYSEISKYMKQKYGMAPQSAYVKKLISNFEKAPEEQINTLPENEDKHNTVEDNVNADTFSKDELYANTSKVKTHQDRSQKKSHNPSNNTQNSIEQGNQSPDKKKEHEAMSARKKYLIDRKRSDQVLTTEELRELWDYTCMSGYIARGRKD